MAAIKRKGYRVSTHCPVCGSNRSGSIHRIAPGALYFTRIFYGCGSIVTTTGPSSEVLVIGSGCRERKTIKK
jgi:hypothetical protein